MHRASRAHLLRGSSERAMIRGVRVAALGSRLQPGLYSRAQLLHLHHQTGFTLCFSHVCFVALCRAARQGEQVNVKASAPSAKVLLLPQMVQLACC